MTRVNLITGFLGSGKTTTLLHLLANKPADENWAILVNEFGEIGIDGALLADRGATLKEIPGGCMCCVNGLPLQVGLNMLLKQAKPDRLIIEPTGLGHPKQLLNMLRAAVYQPWIQVDATLTLLDPRQLADARVVENENFRDQLVAADIIVANKSDRWNDDDRQRLHTWQQQFLGERQLVEAAWGRIDPALLTQPALADRAVPDAAHHHQNSRPQGLAALKLDGQARWRRALNEGQGYASCGWIFDGETVFDTIKALEWARHAPVDRVKGVLRTADGLVNINRQGDDLFIETRPTTPPDSRIELIHHQPADWNLLQTALLKIRLN
ncbi:GTP-binding protein [Pantoea sp. PNT02]|uniref:CobW family GTP-binding protein n=1 Tax=unclassified Pantoea TaxID=2630326 RepID=UPI0017830742|nr:GTP-binding protein [Pantoea sp. SS70]MBD9642364.1 GTP-binding protein [Pantoea sp. PNT02]MBY4839559.1 GTP-binding protein [Pantoea sp. DY-5]MBY4889147.1 GTP-binding protein [Pantoea sp. DY-15]WGK56023.1 GTP-binding protein [Pantoea sp. SS70]